MGGSKGEQAVYQRQGVNQGLAQNNAWQASQSNPAIAKLLASYGSGGMSYKDALRAAGSTPGGDTGGLDRQVGDLQGQIASIANNGEEEQVRTNKINQIYDQIDQLQAQKQAQSGMSGSAAMDALALGTGTGYKLASDQVMDNPLFSGLFNEGGLKDQAIGQYGKASSDLDADRQALMGRDESYGLTDQDLKAYGQASDNIGRMFGAQGNSLSQALADRGLSSGPNGVAAQSFSGLMGNQAEQLKNAQLQIAQNRINTARGLAESRTSMDLHRQGQAGQLGLGLGQLGNSAQQAAYGQNLEGIKTRAGLSNNNAMLQAGNNAQNQEMNNEFFSQQLATKAPGLWDAIKAGLINGAGYSANQVTAAPGNFAKSFSTNGGKSASSAAGGGGWSASDNASKMYGG